MAAYPETNLAEQLKTVALLIAGGLKTKIFVVSIGGFDTHANQVVEGDKTSGEQAELLNTLSEAIAAFQKDLKLLGLEQRVAGMTFSEFGRQIASNDSFGTDHGTANNMFIMGGNLKSAGVMNAAPNLSDLDKGDLKYQLDFRQVYAEVLQDWLKADRTKVIPGKWDRLGLFA